MFDLRTFRKDKGLLQKDIAILLGCTQVNVSLIETGARGITSEQMDILTAKYGDSELLPYMSDEDLPQTVQGNEVVLTVVKEQAKQIERLLTQIDKFQGQIDSLISIIEKMNERK